MADDTAQLSTREYASEDRAACLTLFNSNVPEYFAAAERDQYASFLQALPCRYLVISSPAVGIVAAGGYYVTENPEIGALAWGLVARAWHGRGVGTRLLEMRLTHLRERGVKIARIRTSPHSRGFFERAGFRLLQVGAQESIPDDLVELRLALHAVLFRE